MEKGLDYSRLNVLGSKFKEFLDTLPNGSTENPDFEILLLAHDVKNKTCGIYTMLDKDDERESLVQCIDKCLSGAALKGKDKNPNEWEILNGIGEYMMRLCAMFPSIYENFQKGVEKYIERKKNEQQEQ